MRGAVVLLRQLFLPPCHFAGQTNDHVVFIGLSVNRDGAECSAFDPHGLTSSRSRHEAPTPRRQTSLASMSGHPCFASLARLPDRSTPCRPASAEASNPLLAPRPIPSGIGMTKPTMQQARDRAEVVSGAIRPERVVCHERRLSTTVRNCTRHEG